MQNPIYNEESQDWRSKVRILNLGCGNSILAEDMYDHGFTNICNMDISTVVIQQMQERNAEKRPELKCNHTH